MEFKKFNSIENSCQLDFIKSIHCNGFGKKEYIVQEKVHGANFSFITNGKETVTAKRTGLIGENENFYNSKTVQERYNYKLKLLFEYLHKTLNINTLTVFGEIFGGGYPYKEVPKNENAKLVQRGIYYNPGNDFFAFDIFIDNKEYLDIKSANKLFKKFDFLYAKTLLEGSLQNCLDYSNKFKTTIPLEYGLPELEGNICEGVVIRPLKPLFLNSGSRVIIKSKNENWSENNNYIDKEILSKLLHEDEKLSEDVEKLCEEVYKYISTNRLSNVISKIGEVNPKKDFGKVLGMFNKDILSDFLKEYKMEYGALEKHESKVINKFVNKHANQLVIEYFEE
ncbi:MAG: RNA ligase family protein [Polaribacter sp.]